jgi:hypothetical protein
MIDYLNAIEEFNSYSAGTKAVFTTGPEDNNQNTELGWQRHQKHLFIRDFVAQNTDRILFDFADILSHDDNGILRNGSGWKDGNGVLHVFPYMCSVYDAEYDGGDGACHLSEAGCIKLAKAQWWMLARIAGWNGLPE